jgi:hypothetical protein
MPKLRDQRVTAILAGAVSARTDPRQFSKPQGIIQLAEGE